MPDDDGPELPKGIVIIGAVLLILLFAAGAAILLTGNTWGSDG